MTGLQRTIIANSASALTQARQLLASDPAAAAAQARHLIQSNPGNAAALRLLGAALRKLGQADEAAKAEHDAIQVSARQPGHRAAAQALQAGNAAGAQAQLRRLLAEDDGDVLALTMLGLQASNAREFEVAEPLLRRAVTAAPAEPSPRLGLAEMLHHAKRPAEALAELDQVAGEAAASEAVRSLRAEILSGLGRLDEELAIFEELAAGTPDPGRYGLRIGHALRSLGRSDEAVEAYRAITAANPAEGTAWWSLANLKTTRFDDAEIAAMEAGLAQPGAARPATISGCNFALGQGV